MTSTIAGRTQRPADDRQVRALQSRRPVELVLGVGTAHLGCDRALRGPAPVQVETRTEREQTDDTDDGRDRDQREGAESDERRDAEHVGEGRRVGLDRRDVDIAREHPGPGADGRQDDQLDEDQQHGVPQERADGAARREALLAGGERRGRLGDRGAEEPVREHRHDRQRDEQRRGERDRDGQRERPEELAGDVGHERERQEHRDRRDRGCGDRDRDLAHPGLDGIQLVLAEAQVPLDVLDHDDRVVDHAADRDRQRAEREDVERVAEREHADEGEQHRDRDRDGGDDRRAQRDQEDEDDDDGEQEAEQPLLRERLDRLLDERRLVEHDGELRAVAERLGEAGQSIPHRVGDLDRVAGRGLGDRDGQRRLAVHPRVAGHRLVGDRRRRRRRRSSSRGARRPVLVEHRVGRAAEQGDRGDVVGRRQARAALHDERAVALGDRALREQHAVGVERVADRLVAEPARGERVGVRGDLDALGGRAEQRGIAHVVDLLQVAEGRRLEACGQLVLVEVAGHRDDQDRKVGERPRDHARVDRLRQRADAVDRELHLLLDRREVGAVGERRGDAGQAGGRGGRRRLEPGHAADRRLDRGRDVRLDDIGTRAGVLGDDHELRQRDRREQLLLQRGQSDPAEDADDDRQQGDERAVAQAEHGQQVHGSPRGEGGNGTPLCTAPSVSQRPRARTVLPRDETTRSRL